MKDILMDVILAALMGVSVRALMSLARSAAKAADAWLLGQEQAAKEQQDTVAAKTFETARGLLDSMVYNAVAAMEQTTAKDLRAKVKAGLADPKELSILATDVLYAVKEQLTPGITETLQAYVADLDKYITAQIESSLLTVKNASAAMELNCLEPAGAGVAETAAGSGAAAEA